MAANLNQTHIVDGKQLAFAVQKKLKQELKCIPVPLRFAAVLVGENRASEVYLKEKEKMAESLGISFRLKRYPASISTRQLRVELFKLRNQLKPDGLLIQLPLPESISVQYILNSVPSKIDVDVLSSRALGKFYTDANYIKPPTVSAIMHVLESEKVKLEGAEIVIVGRGLLVGKPLMVELVRKGATVTVCHSQTKNIASHTRRAEVIISATGKPGLITKTMIKQAAVVIDAGSGTSFSKNITRVKGDVETEALKGIASSITPVPNGIGPLSVIYLFHNLYTLWQKCNR